jgi:hypothetical protein
MNNISSSSQSQPFSIAFNPNGEHEHPKEVVLLTLRQHFFNMEFGIDPHIVFGDGADRMLVLLYFIPLMVIGILGEAKMC